jgi:cytoskeletal protein CcmA (bactofilin family)
MSTLGKSISLKGELWCRGDLTLEGRIEGPVWCEEGAVTVAATAAVTGDIIARDVTVFGRTAGQIIATDTVDLRDGADVSGQMVTPRFILAEGASFKGRVEPQHLEAALRVAKYNQHKRDGKSAPEPAPTAAP